MTVDTIAIREKIKRQKRVYKIYVLVYLRLRDELHQVLGINLCAPEVQ